MIIFLFLCSPSMVDSMVEEGQCAYVRQTCVTMVVGMALMSWFLWWLVLQCALPFFKGRWGWKIGVLLVWTVWLHNSFDKKLYKTWNQLVNKYSVIKIIFPSIFSRVSAIKKSKKLQPPKIIRCTNHSHYSVLFVHLNICNHCEP